MITFDIFCYAYTAIDVAAMALCLMLPPQRRGLLLLAAFEL